MAKELDNLEKWAKDADSRLNVISSQLSEIESLFNNVPSDCEDPSVMEFLMQINKIQEMYQDVVEALKDSKKQFKEMRTDLQMQMNVLQKTFEQFNLETEKRN